MTRPSILWIVLCLSVALNVGQYERARRLATPAADRYEFHLLGNAIPSVLDRQSGDLFFTYTNRVVRRNFPEEWRAQSVERIATDELIKQDQAEEDPDLTRR